MIGNGLKSTVNKIPDGKKLLVRILIDDWDQDFNRVVNKIYNSKKEWGLNSDKVIVQMATYPHILPIGVFHDKYVVIDSKIVVIIGANAEIYHDSSNPWHNRLPKPH